MTTHRGSRIALRNAVEVATEHGDITLADDLRSLERKVHVAEAVSACRHEALTVGTNEVVCQDCGKTWRGW
jgi:hypothetical protein